MPKSHKPGPESNISIIHKKKIWSARNMEFWENWDPSTITSYLMVPKSIRKFSKYDPRKNKWRVRINE